MKLANDLEIADIGLGTFPNKEKLEGVIPEALELGYRLFDTSDDYYNEKYVGIGLRGRYDEKTYVTTKFSFHQYFAKVGERLDNSKKELNISEDFENIIYLMHFPYPSVYVEIWKQMEQLYKEGKCKAIGVCNFEIKHLKRLEEECEIMPMINQIELHPLFQQKELCAYCADRGIKIMAYSPVARHNEKLFGDEALNDIAKKYNKTLSQVIMRWNVQSGRSVIPATTSSEHLKENMDVFDFVLSEKEMQTINELDEGMRIRYNPNTMFRYRLRLKLFVKYILYKMFKKR